MKKVLLVLVAVLAFGTLSAQKMWKNEVDEFTGSTVKITNYYNIATTSVGLIKASIARIDSFFYLKLKSTSDLGCAGARDNYVTIIFTDGTKITLDDDKSDIKCADSSSSMFSLDKDSPLFTKAVSKVRFRQSKYYTDGKTSGTYTLAQMLGVTK